MGTRVVRVEDILMRSIPKINQQTVRYSVGREDGYDFLWHLSRSPCSSIAE